MISFNRATTGLLLLLAACAQPSIGTGAAFRGVMSPADPVRDPTGLKRRIGRRLFFDRRLSSDRSMSCASCHVPTRLFSERIQTAHGLGGESRRRNTPSLYNAALLERIGWDGASADLADQVLATLSLVGDFGRDTAGLAALLRRDAWYDAAFVLAYGRLPAIDIVVESIVAFEQTLLVGGSPFDRFFFQGDSLALSAEARRGWEVFQDQPCAGCHVPVTPDPRGLGSAMFTDQRFHNLGVGYSPGRYADLGRWEVTHLARDIGRFRTPSLRNVGATAPYMHDGSLATLADVVDFYERGGIHNPNLDAAIRPFRLTAGDRDALIAFLESLTTPALLDQAQAIATWGGYADPK